MKIEFREFTFDDWHQYPGCMDSQPLIAEPGPYAVVIIDTEGVNVALWDSRGECAGFWFVANPMNPASLNRFLCHVQWDMLSAIKYELRRLRFKDVI
jgi:hypothetical protein